jgi:hypothetical protein
MMMLVSIGFVIGALLAPRFRVFVLLPVIILGALAISIAGTLHPIAAIYGEIAGYAISLQFGYLFGAGAHHILIGNHVTRPLARGRPY